MLYLELRRFGVLMALLALVALPYACNDDPECGDGRTEGSEQCDCGTDPNYLPAGCTDINGGPNSGCSSTCRLVAVNTTRIIMQWTINGQSHVGSGSFDTCPEVHASTVHVHVTGPAYDAEQDNSCGAHQATFVDDPRNNPLPPGHYAAQLSILSGQATELAPSQTVEFDVISRQDNVVVVDFPLETFYDYDSYSGDLGFWAYWDVEMGTCGDASPVVLERSYTLMKDDVPLPGYPDVSTCDTETQLVEDLDPGWYQLLVEGMDATGFVNHCEVFDVKVGVGTQPYYVLTVPAIQFSQNCQ